MVYFCDFNRSEIFLKNARELGVGHGQFHSGDNGLRYAIFTNATNSKPKYKDVSTFQLEIQISCFLRMDQ